MRAYSVGRGTQEGDQKFTTRPGLSMAQVIGAATLRMLLLCLFGFFS